MKLAKIFSITVLTILLTSMATNLIAIIFVTNTDIVATVSLVCKDIAQLTISSVFMLMTIALWKELKISGKIVLTLLGLSTIIFAISCTFPSQLNVIAIPNSEIAIYSFLVMLASGLASQFLES